MAKYKLKDPLKFGGENYRFWQYYMSKVNAKRRAKSLRKEGWKARVVSRKGSDGKTYHLLYRRKK